MLKPVPGRLLQGASGRRLLLRRLLGVCRCSHWRQRPSLWWRPASAERGGGWGWGFWGVERMVMGGSLVNSPGVVCCSSSGWEPSGSTTVCFSSHSVVSALLVDAPQILPSWSRPQCILGVHRAPPPTKDDNHEPIWTNFLDQN